MKKILILYLFIFFACAPPAEITGAKNSNQSIEILNDVNIKEAPKGKFAATKDEKKVVAFGFGANPDQALQKALRNAVEEAVGSYISSNTLIENDDLIEDKILSLSRGFIKDFRTLSTEKIDGETKVTVAAIVTGDQVIETLKSSGVEVEIKGNLLFSQFSDFQSQMDDEAKLVESLFSEVPANSPFDFIVSNDTPVQLEGQSGFKVQLSVKAVVNKNYTILMQNIKNILDAIALDYTDIKIKSITLGCKREERLRGSVEKGDCKPPYIRTIGSDNVSTRYGAILKLNVDKEKNNLFKLKPMANSEWESFRNLYSNHFKDIYYNNVRLKTVEGKFFATGDLSWKRYDGYGYVERRDGAIIKPSKRPKSSYVDIYEKGKSPYHIGIMLSDDTVRMYRLISSKSFDIIQKYLESYLFDIKFDIIQSFTKKIEYILPNTQNISQELPRGFKRIERINNDIVDSQDNKTKTTFLLELKHSSYYGNISISSSLNASELIYYHFSQYRTKYSKRDDFIKVNGPSSHHQIFPIINSSFLIYYGLPGQVDISTGRLKSRWFSLGEIHMLGAIPENGSYFTIDNIQMWISPEAFSSLSSIKIE